MSSDVFVLVVKVAPIYVLYSQKRWPCHGH